VLFRCRGPLETRRGKSKSSAVGACTAPLGKEEIWREAMRLATSYEAIGGRKSCLRPAVGFSHPTDVIKDPHLDHREKRAILSSWASDASAVEDEPTQRWLLGTPGPVPYSEVRHALAHLDRLEAARCGRPAPGSFGLPFAAPRAGSA
jgi:hypothetical protein